MRHLFGRFHNCCTINFAMPAFESIGTLPSDSKHPITQHVASTTYGKTPSVSRSGGGNCCRSTPSHGFSCRLPCHNSQHVAGFTLGDLHDLWSWHLTSQSHMVPAILSQQCKRRMTAQASSAGNNPIYNTTTFTQGMSSLRTIFSTTVTGESDGTPSH